MHVVENYLDILQEKINKSDKKRIAIATGTIAAASLAHHDSHPGIKALSKFGIALNIIVLALIAFKIYMQHNSDKCQPNDLKCKKQVKIQAYEKQILYLRAHIGRCDGLKNETSCKKQVMNKIDSTQSKIKSLRG
jgi:hypothetical protein